MDKPVTFAICGLGIRGLEAYAAFQKQHPEKMKITAGADPDPDRRAALQANYGVPAGSCFATGEELLAQPRLADVMIIATQDRQHVAQALAALDKGYHLVLEKPISQEALVEGGVFPQKKLEEMVRDEEFASLPHALQEGMAALLKDLAVKPDVSRIDTALDVAYSQYVLEELGHVKDENIRQIFQITFDFDNVMILLRLKRKGASRQMLKNTLLYGGSISHELLEEIYPLSVSEIAAILSKGKYEKAMETGFLEYTRKNTLDGFARERDNGIMEIARKNRHDMLTIAPVIGYMLGKQREAEAVRMVMISKLNQISSEDTLNRVRDLYV